MNTMTKFIFTLFLILACDLTKDNTTSKEGTDRNFTDEDIYISDTVTEEEYYIYSKVIPKIYNGFYDEIHFTAAHKPTRGADGFYEAALHGVPDVDSLMLKRLRLTEYPYDITFENKFLQLDTIPIIKFMSDSVYQAIFNTGYWNTFLDLNPNFDALIIVGRIAFNKDHTLGMFQVEIWPSVFSGDNYVFVVRKIEDDWHLEYYLARFVYGKQ